MSFEIWLAGSPQVPMLPVQWMWTGLLTIGLAMAVARSFPRNMNLRSRGLTRSVGLILLAAPAGGIFLLRLGVEGPATIAGVPLAPAEPVAGILTGAWLLLVGAFGGPFAAVAAGLSAGLVRAVWDTHQAATALEYALIGWAAGECIHQPYAGRFFALLRRPWGAALAMSAAALFLRFGTELGSARGDLVTLFDFAIERFTGNAAAIALETTIGAVLMENVRWLVGRRWPAPATLRPTAYHQSIAWKVSLWLALPLAAMALSITAIVAINARQQAREALQQKIRDAARVAQSSLPVALTTGHTLLEGMASEIRALPQTGEDISTFLGRSLSHPPFFESVGYLSADGRLSAQYPKESAPVCREPAEAEACALAALGVAWDGWENAGSPSRSVLVFAQPVADSDGRPVGVLIGRTSLETNPLLMSIPVTFSAIEGGQGVLMDSSGRIVYPADAEPWLGGEVLTRESDGGVWLLDTMPGGGTRIGYLLPLQYPAWKIGLRVPEAGALRTALGVGLNVGLLALLAAALTETLALLIAQQITSPLRKLAESAGQIAAGNLEKGVSTSGSDEIGLLAGSLEAMRRSLRRQMREQELLLRTSQGMAQHTTLSAIADLLLRSARTASQAQGIRLSLAPGLGEGVESVSLSLGEMGRELETLDAEWILLAREQALFTANRFSGVGDDLFASMSESVGAVVVVRIGRGANLFGALCVAYRDLQAFEVATLDLLEGLANQAALALANSRTLENAEGDRQRMAAILDAIPEGVVVADSDGRLLYASPAFEEMLGVAVRGFDRPLAESIPLPELVRFIMEQAVQPRSRTFEVSRGRALQGLVRSILSVDGGAVWQVAVLQDISRFRQLDELKSEFVHTVSHDLRRPLTVIEGLTNMLEMLGPLNPAQKEYAQRIRVSAQNMLRLVKDLLDLGRVENGLELRRITVDAAAVVRRVAEEWKTEAAAANLELSLDLEDGLPALQADAALLERALGNLVENAIRFNKPGGSVQIRAGVKEESLVFAVRDTGIGIAPSDQPRVFEKFYRVAARPDSDDASWGLGLAIVKQVADWHGGRVWMESRLGQGSEFFLALPLRGG